MSRGIILEPDMIPESNSDFEDNPGYSHGKIELMGGSIELQIVPVKWSSSEHVIGRNGACLVELERIVKDTSLPDIKRTIRTILR